MSGPPMAIAIRQLHPHFVGEVAGVQLGRPPAASVLRTIAAAIDRYAVLVFRDQDLDDERQMAFAANFGEIETPRSGAAAIERRLRPELSDISNLDEQGRLRAAGDPR